MKYLVLASACAALLATPALAQSGYGYDEPASPAAGSASQGCSTVPDAKANEPCPSSLSSPKPLSLAADHTTGMIASIDIAANTITLDDGKTYGVAMDVALNSFMVGQKVTIAFADREGKLNATDVKPAEGGAPAAN
jgi:Protein of unknown function (DUF1344)